MEIIYFLRTFEQNTVAKLTGFAGKKLCLLRTAINYNKN